MNFELTEEHLAVQEAARDFAQKELKPGVIERDTNMTHATEQIKKMGNMKDLIGMIPGAGKMMKGVDIDDDAFKGIEAIIHSMTPAERSNPSIINSSRKKRIGKGSGTSVQEVNQLLKQFTQMSKMMKMMQGGGGKRMMQMMGGMKGMR